MTKFEQVGVNLQMESGSAGEAKRKFGYSCQVCCNRGMYIKCDNCSISAVHRQVIATFEEQVEEEGVKENV